MNINYFEKTKTFKLDTLNTSYLFQVSFEGVLEHLYYGAKISDSDIGAISNRQIYSFGAHFAPVDRKNNESTFLKEYSVFNSGDFRNCGLNICDNEVSKRFNFSGFKIYQGKDELVGLPSSRNNDEVETLEVNLINGDKTMKIVLYYSVYYNCDVITRNACIYNLSNKDVVLTKIASMNLDFNDSDYTMLTLDGLYLGERSKVTYRKIDTGVTASESLVGTSSHHTNPFFALMKANADDFIGEVYGFNLVYSGNFKNLVEVDRLGQTRVISGINDCNLVYTLKENEVFTTPEVVMTYSNNGLNKMSQNMHKHILNNIIDPKYHNKKHPIVLNTWEAYYFDIDEDKLISLCDKAKLCGVDTIVLDDGWFRPNDQGGLGDFRVIKEKFPSLKKLAEKIHNKGLKFGIWIEPEMVAMLSDLYKNNPSCILSTDPSPLLSRNQFILDLTNEDNINYIYNRLVEEFAGVEIDYIKWDYNRYLTEASSNTCPNGEIYHKQTLGTYKLFKLITEHFKDTFFETCSGGGGRFDLGMLYYSAQIWTSDNTDPYERTYIQYGTSIAYPQSTISCHFSEGNCTSGRASTYDFRYLVASFGSYGYELNLNKYSNEEVSSLKVFTDRYNEKVKLIEGSDLYRIISPSTNTLCAYMNVAYDKSVATLSFIELFTRALKETTVIHLDGLDENTLYKNDYNDEILSGKALKYVGFRINNLFRDISVNGLEVKFTKIK